MTVNRAFADLGLWPAPTWPHTLIFALGGLVVLVACSPIADRIATRLVAAPPNLKAFRALQRSWIKLIIGIVIAWLLGGFIEEIVLRGVVVQSAARLLTPNLGVALASVTGVAAAAIVAWIAHLYQGPRAALIVAQLSLIFGAIYLVSGGDLWSAILAHGLYDTIAFVRFALGKSKYSTPESV